jgi:hypothetical protein
MMLKRMAILAVLAASPLLVPAAQAQNAAQSGVLVIYGNDKCPTNDNGEEIVVCQRLDEAERFRIPQTLREQPTRPQVSESWSVRSQDALSAGRTGVGSCSTVGAGGGIGCATRNISRGTAEARARREEAANLPLP